MPIDCFWVTKKQIFFQAIKLTVSEDSLKPHPEKILVRLGITSNPLGAEAPLNIASQPRG